MASTRSSSRKGATMLSPSRKAPSPTAPSPSPMCWRRRQARIAELEDGWRRAAPTWTTSASDARRTLVRAREQERAGWPLRGCPCWTTWSGRLEHAVVRPGPVVEGVRAVHAAGTLGVLADLGFPRRDDTGRSSTRPATRRSGPLSNEELVPGHGGPGGASRLRADDEHPAACGRRGGHRSD